MSNFLKNKFSLGKYFKLRVVQPIYMVFLSYIDVMFIYQFIEVMFIKFLW